jgi:ABC-type Fe3+ transport system substrate-binding protein
MQRAAILKGSPHPDGAKLLHNFMISREHQQQTESWSVRKDVSPPAGYPDLMGVSTTNPAEFERRMADRSRVVRLRLFLEDKIGPLQGLSPLMDDL